jgi:hypothetical protein
MAIAPQAATCRASEAATGARRRSVQCVITCSSACAPPCPRTSPRRGQRCVPRAWDRERCRAAATRREERDRGRANPNVARCRPGWTGSPR